MIKVDINTKAVSDEVRVFVTRPGGKYRHYGSFVEHNFVGPDLPDLRPADIAPEFLVDAVSRSNELRKRILRPSIDETLSTSEQNVSQPLKASPQLVRIARAFLTGIKAGDLVIVPPINFRGEAYIGEVVSNSLAQLTVDIYPGYPLLGRRVKWLSTIKKSDLPAQTLDALQKPLPIFLVDKNAWPAIFRRAYGSYHTSKEFGARFAITSNSFNIVDDFNIQAFFNFVSANTDRVSKNETELYSLQDGAFANIDGVSPDLYTNVNSPGALSLKSAFITPIVIAVMLTLATTVGQSAYAKVLAGQIVFGNTLAPDTDPCSALVQEQVITQITLLGFDRWAEACLIAQKAAAQTGISTGINVEGP